MRRLPWRLWLALSALWIGAWLLFFSAVKISVTADTAYLLIVFGTPVAVLAGTALIGALVARRRR